jgi:hypothetical protein
LAFHGFKSINHFFQKNCFLSAQDSNSYFFCDYVQFCDFVAAKNGKKEIVEILLKNKAKVNLKDVNGYSALILGNF